jgi:hypothetical protein
MTYQKWEWRDDATEEQTESASNKAAVTRLAAEARTIYDSIPESRRDDDDDGRDDFEFDSVEEMHAFEAKQKQMRTEAFGQLEALEELLSARGACFTSGDGYERWNEDAERIRYLESKENDCPYR